MSSPHHEPPEMRLCTKCGMCCDGAMFRRVELQAGDSSALLSRLGFKLKKRNGRQCFLQPCPAHHESRCSLYEQRPARCRVFECRQLMGLKDGTIDETQAQASIRLARVKIDALVSLFRQCQTYDPGKSLARNYQDAVDRLSDSPLPALDSGRKRSLEETMSGLQDILNRHFRVEPLDWVTENC